MKNIIFQGTAVGPVSYVVKAADLAPVIILGFIFYIHLMYVGAFCRLLNKRILYSIVPRVLNVIER